MKARSLQAPLCSLYVILTLLLALAARAQQAHVKLYTVTDGLPIAIVHAIYQDKSGYLWLGTPAGLSRYDGRQFVNYSITDGLPSTITGLAFEDSNQRLWLATNAGSAEFNSSRFF